MIQKIIISSLLIFTLSSISYAKELTQTDLNIAANQHFDVTDFMLNKAYQQLLGSLDNNRKQQLIKAQRAWLKFRDLNANLISSRYEGGSIRPLIHSQTLIEITNNRIAELTKMHLDEITQ